MTIYEGVTLFIIIIGIIVILASFLVNKAESDKDHVVQLEDYEEYQSRIKEINQKILELNDYSVFMKTELEGKHKELLFLYQLIRDKEKSLNQIESSQVITLQQPKISEQNTFLGHEHVVQENSNKRIIELSQKGYSISEIAKMLEIGQGQVKLVLDLYK
jgi:L-rhamnose mutarotase